MCWAYGAAVARGGCGRLVCCDESGGSEEQGSLHAMEGCGWRRWWGQVGMNYQAAAQAAKRFAQTLPQDPERRRFVAKPRSELSTI